jgi:hypothetical protein
MEVKSELLMPVRVHYVCDKCRSGYMLSTRGPAITSNPPRYPHACTNKDCKNVAYFPVTYPTVFYDVQPIIEEETCPECKEGIMVFTGGVKEMAPPLFEHKCNKCGHTADLNKYFYDMHKIIKNNTPTIV